MGLFESDFLSQLGMSLNAQSPQFHIHIKLLYVLMSKSTPLKEKLFFICTCSSGHNLGTELHVHLMDITC